MGKTLQPYQIMIAEIFMRLRLGVFLRKATSFYSSDLIKGFLAGSHLQERVLQMHRKVPQPDCITADI